MSNSIESKIKKTQNKLDKINQELQDLNLTSLRKECLLQSKNSLEANLKNLQETPEEKKQREILKKQQEKQERKENTFQKQLKNKSEIESIISGYYSDCNCQAEKDSLDLVVKDLPGGFINKKRVLKNWEKQTYPERFPRKREELYSVSELVARGWSKTSIDKFLPKPDDYRDNPYYKCASPMKFYLKSNEGFWEHKIFDFQYQHFAKED